MENNLTPITSTNISGAGFSGAPAGITKSAYSGRTYALLLAVFSPSVKNKALVTNTIIPRVLSQKDNPQGLQTYLESHEVRNALDFKTPSGFLEKFTAYLKGYRAVEGGNGIYIKERRESIQAYQISSLVQTLSQPISEKETPHISHLSAEVQGKVLERIEHSLKQPTLSTEEKTNILQNTARLLPAIHETGCGLRTKALNLLCEILKEHSQDTSYSLARAELLVFNLTGRATEEMKKNIFAIYNSSIDKPR